MEGSRILFCSSEFPRASEGISSKIIDNLNKRSQNVSPVLAYGFNDRNEKLTSYLRIIPRGKMGGPMPPFSHIRS
jgi:hypothetical protein